MEEVENYWYWKDIRISTDLVGETVDKGTGIFEKKYTYIKIPKGYGYDNYSFLLSKNCVHIDSDTFYFSIHYDMKIELIYDVELREYGKKYKRYKLTGCEIFEKIFKDYEVNFIKEYEERVTQERKEKEKRNRDNIGEIICGIYNGNIYSNKNPKYREETIFRAYFIGNNHCAYSNSEFDKVRNVKREFIIFENISRYHFLEFEAVINAYLHDYTMYKNMYITLETRLKEREVISKSKSLMKTRLGKEKMIVTNTEDIVHVQMNNLKESMEEIKKRLRERIENWLDYKY